MAKFEIMKEGNFKINYYYNNILSIYKDLISLLEKKA